MTPAISWPQRRESDLSQELRRLTGNQPVIAGYDPAGRGAGRDEAGAWRTFTTGIWLVDDPSQPVDERQPYAVGVNSLEAFCAAVTRALTEVSRSTATPSGGPA